MRDDYDQTRGKIEYLPKVRSARINVIETSSKTSKRRRRRRPIWLKLFNWKWFLLVITTSSLLVAGFVSSLLLAAQFQKLDRVNQLAQGPRIIQKNNQDIYFQFIPIEKIRIKNDMLVNAFVKVEDVRFYRHDGVDYSALVRATLKTLLGEKQGGGTITMQVARNVVIESHAQKMSRKLNEIAVAWNLDRKFSKDKILETYLNGIEFGNQIQGVYLAAKAYFGKELDKETLTPQEVAILVSIINGPGVFDPYRSAETRENLRQRVNKVLAVMANNNDSFDPLITPEERDQAIRESLALNSRERKNQILKAFAD